MAGKAPTNIRELNVRASELVEQILDPATDAEQNRKLIKELEYIMTLANKLLMVRRAKIKHRKISGG
jgi:hypothetical protein